MTRRTCLQLLACVAALRPGAAAAQTSAPSPATGGWIPHRMTISGAQLIAARDCPPGQIWALGADWDGRAWRVRGVPR